MPISRITPDSDQESEIDGSLDVFQIHEAIEVYDGPLALAIDHLMNHIKTLISLSYLPASQDLEKALKRHPLLRRMNIHESFFAPGRDGRSPDRILLKECQDLMEAVVEIAHLAAWPETSGQARVELENLRRRVPFLDYRYDNDPFPSDSDHEEHI
jgi:hypothetical protein